MAEEMKGFTIVSYRTFADTKLQTRRFEDSRPDLDAKGFLIIRTAAGARVLAMFAPGVWEWLETTEEESAAEQWSGGVSARPWRDTSKFCTAHEAGADGVMRQVMPEVHDAS